MIRKSLEYILNNGKLPTLSGVVIILITLAGCTTNYYITAHQLQMRGNYVGAIENYDDFIARSRDGAMKTKAMNLRSQAYFDIGLEAMERANYRLAIRLFYLANTFTADSKMVECYLKIADNANNSQDYDQVLQIYNYIIDTFQTLPETPNVVYRRLLYYYNIKKDEANVWNNYLLLVDTYNDSEHIEKVIPIIDNYMNGMIQRAVQLKHSKDYETAINQLLFYKKYPHSLEWVINMEVGILYYELADQRREQEDYFKAYDYYRVAVEYNSDLQTEVDARLNEMITLMVNYGNSLLQERKVDEALALFRQTYNIVPNNSRAKEAIERANELAENIRTGAELYAQAQNYERDENYLEALRIYRQSYARDRLQRTADKIFLMTNLIEIENNPVAFARTIITDFRNGIIERNLNSIISRMRNEYGDEVRVSGWRIMLSTGTNRYEVRYDITSRSENHFLIWQVNLLNRNIVPLNKDSEEIMGGV